MSLSSSNPDHRATLESPPPNSIIEVDDRFRYETDDQGRVVKSTATLDVVDLEHPRDRSAQRRLVDKLPGDHAGHLFARIFQGPLGSLNLTPMEARKVNLGAFATIEKEWRREIGKGKSVDVEITLTYQTDTRRPDYMDIRYAIDGVLQKKTIRNRPRRQN